MKPWERQYQATSEPGAEHQVPPWQRQYDTPEPEPDGMLERGAQALHEGMNALQDAPVIGPIFRGVRNTAQGIAQGVARGGNALGLVDDQTVSDYESMAKGSRDQYARNNPGLLPKAGEIAGEIASTLPMAAGKGLLAAASGGASYGATRPVDDPDYGAQKVKDTLIGAGSGAIGHGVVAGAGRLMGRTGKAQKGLIDEGIRLTPGQAKGGAIQAAEDRLAGFPLVGDVINRSKGKAVEDLNRVAYNRVLAPIGKTFPKGEKVGREGINALEDTLSQAYDDLLPKMRGQIDAPFMDAMNSTIKQLGELYPARAKTLHTLLQKTVVNRAKNGGQLDGETMKLVQRELGEAVRKHSKGMTAEDQYIADALMLTKDAFNQMLTRANKGTTYADDLAKINEGWANFVRVREAGSAIGAGEGVFSAAQLSRAVRKHGKGSRTPLMQDLSDPAKSAMGQKIPDSGTAGRMAAGLLATGNLGLGAVSPLAAAGLAGVTLPYLAPNATRMGLSGLGRSVRAGGAPVGLFLSGNE